MAACQLADLEVTRSYLQQLQSMGLSELVPKVEIYYRSATCKPALII